MKKEKFSNSFDKQYVETLNDIHHNGVRNPNRTGIDRITKYGVMLSHDMSEGFPILTFKKTLFKVAMVELEGFLKGITSKQWYIDNGCNIWNQWCRRDAEELEYAETEAERLQMQLDNDDLGPIYGAQLHKGYPSPMDRLLDQLTNNPTSSEIYTTYWNNEDLDRMALPPCHVGFHVNIINDTINLNWYQRSADWLLGVPFNMVYYATLLSLLGRQFNKKPGIIVGSFSNAHVYVNQLDCKGVWDVLWRSGYAESLSQPLPKLRISNEFKSIRNFKHDQVSLRKYKHGPFIKIPIAI